MSDLIIKLKKPYTFEGETCNEIDLEGLDSLTGIDLIKVKQLHAQRNKGFVGLPSTDQDYCILVAARATDLPVEYFEQLPANAFNQVYMKVLGFLNSDSEE